MLGIDPFIISMIAFAVTFYCAYEIGRGERKKDIEDAIENTILYMVHNNFVKFTRDEDGEIEIHSIDDVTVTKLSQLEK
jgi:hypothetical protein